jgi:hypothetical protein
MSQPPKRKRTEDVDPPVKSSRRRLNVFKTEDVAKERIARYRQSHPVSIRPCRLSMIHRPRFLTHRRT